LKQLGFEEQARGDTGKAEAIRVQVMRIIGDNLASVKPGSREADEIKRVLVAQGAWSQYLEVGIGPDAEIFTKSQVMSAVGLGAEVGLHPKSSWNNPEPEIVLAVTAAGETVGATLGNDVNLRDFEGRSALLLGKSKDNNASCAIGPFIRLFDEKFGMDDVRQAELALEIAECARLIKGYGETHRRAKANFLRIMDTLVEGGTFQNERARAVAIAKAREAALADPEGKALQKVLASAEGAAGAVAGRERQAGS